MSEFELIQRYFTDRQSPQSTITLGIGDDCALMSNQSGMQMAISTDMLIEGRHFFSGADARMLGYKCLAVNLSDLAAMGAEPRAFTLALALPEVQPTWLEDFSEGLFELANQHHCQLIGGDTTKGPRTLCITVFGEVPIGQSLRRDAAQVGDDIWISGSLGEAKLALEGYLKKQLLSEQDQHQSAHRLHMPTPRIVLGMALRGIAHAAIDVSDGLVGDLGHILTRSKMGATVWCDALPIGPILAKQDRGVQREFALAGGDDYELCFTAPAHVRHAVLAAAKQANTAVTCIGTIEAQPGLRLMDENKLPISLQLRPFDHFL